MVDKIKQIIGRILSRWAKTPVPQKVDIAEGVDNNIPIIMTLNDVIDYLDTISPVNLLEDVNLEDVEEEEERQTEETESKEEPIELGGSKQAVVPIEQVDGELLPDLGFWAIITEHEDADSPARNRWKYSWVEALQDAEGHDNWSQNSEYGEYGKLTADDNQSAYPAYNLAEANNTADSNASPVPDGTVVWMHRSNANGKTVYWFVHYNIPAIKPPEAGDTNKFLYTDTEGETKWVSITDHIKTDLLDGNVHQDTEDEDCQTGDLIYGNANNKWDRLAIGNENQVLTVKKDDNNNLVPSWEDAQSGGGIGQNIHFTWVGAVAGSATVVLDNRDWRGRVVVVSGSAIDTDTNDYTSDEWTVGADGPSYSVSSGKVGSSRTTGQTTISNIGQILIQVDCADATHRGRLIAVNQDATNKRLHVWVWATDPQGD
ncbi:MAG: hypothetical protein DRN20_00490 [Thermoplasmata archaeon]|nr:MAG: hypothetical protein DRN20_00490 [Thermoplasmata archaeon]